MNRLPINDNSGNPSVRLARVAQRENQAVAVQGAVLISRLFYAILIVGFVGYYMDKALQIVRQ